MIVGLDVMYSLTVLTTMHAEGVIANATLRSIEMSRSFALEHRAHTITLLLLLDRANQVTVETALNFAQSRDWVHIEYTDYGDPGLARNHGAKLVDTDFSSVWDGDDLLTINWLHASAEYLNANPAPSICVPQYILTFDNDHVIVEQPSSTSLVSPHLGMLTTNYWGSWITTRTTTLRSVPYVPVFPVSLTGIGSEDWHWNCEQLSNGVTYRAIPNTAVFYRRRSGTRLHIDQTYFRGFPIKTAKTTLFNAKL